MIRSSSPTACVDDGLLSDRVPWQADALRLGLLAGLCLLIGIRQFQIQAVVNLDAIFYISQAQRLPEHWAEVARRYPLGYPWILWAAHQAARAAMGHDSPLFWLHVGQGVTLLCRILALVPLYFLGRLLVGAEKSFWALLILLVLPYPAQFGSEILREWPSVLFLSLGFWLLCWGLRTQRWWVFALVGLDTGLGFLIRPESGQLLLFACLGLAWTWWTARRVRTVAFLGAGTMLGAGFLIAAAPHLAGTGTLKPAQFLPQALSRPPFIQAIGPRQAGADVLEFTVAEGELLELPIAVTNVDGDPITFSCVSVPEGARPVYQFWSTVQGSDFWTLSEDEKNRTVTTYSRDFWSYEGIVCYAYTRVEARSGLRGVHHLWSPTQQQHLYTVDPQEKESLLRESPQGTWEDKGIVFHVFGVDDHPGDAVPVCRVPDAQGRCFWEAGETGTGVSPGPGSRRGTIVWYVPAAGAPPAGITLADGVFRWRPAPGQRGVYEINVIVGRAGLQSCQCLRIKVMESPLQSRSQGRATLCLAQMAALETPSQAANRVFAGVAEDLMIVFFVPWLLGLAWRLREPAERGERILVVAVVATNVGLMLWRHLASATGEDRRYCLGMLALTIFYVPLGVEVMARWLSRRWPLARPSWLPVALRQSSWFYLLLAVGIATCLPKLLLPSHGNKTGYLAAVDWLRQNTRAEDVVAVPDARLSFYAERPGLPYERYPNARRADYVILVDSGTGAEVPEGWRREFAVRVDRRTRKTLVIYNTSRPR